MPYQPPGITITSTGPQTPVLTGPAPRTIGILGTFPQGPDYPVLLAPVQMGAVFGAPSAISSVGYSGPYLANFAGQQQPPSGGPVQFLVCRVGVGRGVYVVKDSALATCFTLSAVGAYAGSASQYLQLKLTVASGAVTTITFSDSRTGGTVGTPLADTSVGGAYDLSSKAAIVAAINATNPLTALGSVVQAAAGSSTLVPTAITTPTAFTTGTDGRAAAYNDGTVAPLLLASLWAQADYIVAGYDGATIGPTLLTHIASALLQNNRRKAVVGPVAGTTFASLSGSYISSGLQSSKLWPLGHDALAGQHPATGAFTAWDGFYGAAALAGLKAAAPTQETCINYQVAGFSGLIPPSDKPSGLIAADLDALAATGQTVLTSSAQDPSLRVRDSLTAAPMFINGATQVNDFAFCNEVDIDDAVSDATVAALRPFKGRTFATPEEAAGLMEAAVIARIGGLGSTTGGVNGDGTHFAPDPITQNITGIVSYRTRRGIRQIPVSIGFV